MAFFCVYDECPALVSRAWGSKFVYGITSLDILGFWTLTCGSCLATGKTIEKCL